VKISKQARRDGKALFNLCKTPAGLDEPRVRATVRAVIAQKPRGYIAILSHFQRLVKLEIARRTAEVESAAPLAAALQAAVTANLAARYGAGLTVKFAVNPALIGGLRVQVGSDVYDGSVKALESDLAAGF